jgi:Phosphotyrosyl phosphate activator (PTPA) protein
MADTASTTTTAAATTVAAAAAGCSPPRRFIYSDADLQAFLASPVKKDLLRFVAAMGTACSTSPWEYDPQRPLRGLTPAMASFHGSLQVMKEWVDDIPPSKAAAMIRFGNPAFREWHQRLTQRARNIVAAMLSHHHHHTIDDATTSTTTVNNNADEVDTEYDDSVLQAAMEQGREAAAATAASSDGSVTTSYEAGSWEETALPELACYLEDAFGHPIRLDYGTGHECSLQVFLFTACRLHLFGSTTASPPTAHRLKAVCLSIYHQYLAVTRRLQNDYRLEPAGSHGVWGLDDYYCLSFYFGACQLDQPDLLTDEAIASPRSIHDTALVRQYKDTYLYYGGIYFIQQIKKNVPFGESSPMLNDISQTLPNWNLVAAGLLKLFEGERNVRSYNILNLGLFFVPLGRRRRRRPHRPPLLPCLMVRF